MNITKKEENGTLILVLSGRLDTTSAPQLEAVLSAVFKETNSVCLDFAGLAYVSSAGLRVLLWGAKTVKLNGGTMPIINVSADIIEVFKMTGFYDILTIV